MVRAYRDVAAYGQMIWHRSSELPQPGQRAIRVLSFLVSGVLIAWLVSGCGLSQRARSELFTTWPVHGLHPAPNEVADRVARAAPVDLYSHVVGERHRLARIAPALLKLLAEYPESVIVIEGHAADYGLQAGYNDRLALERARAVQRFLLDAGFPHDRLRTVSFGDRAPECPVLDDPCGRMNRRVHFRAAAQAASDGRIGKWRKRISADDPSADLSASVALSAPAGNTGRKAHGFRCGRQRAEEG